MEEYEVPYASLDETGAHKGPPVKPTIVYSADGPAASKNLQDKYSSLDLEGGEQQSLYTAPIWTRSSIAIPLSYMCVGFLLTFPSAVIQYYPRTLEASDSQLSTISTVRSLPWNFKLFYGFCSDAFPIFGYHRKPYMLLGYVICSVGNLIMAAVATPSVVEFTMLLLLYTFGLIMADVMADALVATRAKNEPLEFRGQTQSLAYLCRFSAEIVGYWCGAVLFNKEQWGWGLTLTEVFLVMALVPLLLMVPSIAIVEEPKILDLQPVRSQLRSIWELLSNRAVWQPLLFIFTYSSLMTYNAAWGNFLEVRYHFSPFQYASMGAVGSMVMFTGVYTYKKVGLQRECWRAVYFWTTVIISVVSSLNVMLVFGVNESLNINAYWFSMGDSIMVTFVAGIQFLPSSLMFVQLCPDGQEGVAYALLTGFQNIAGGVSSTISNLLLGIWPVQLEDFKAGDFDGVWKLTILANIINLIPLALLWMLPKGKSGLDELKKTPINLKIGAGMMILMFLATIWTVVLSILAVTTPCYKLVGGHGCHGAKAAKLG